MRTYIDIVAISFLLLCSNVEAKIIETRYVEDVVPSIDAIETYFKNFEVLAKTENWSEIISQGTKALDVAKMLGRVREEAKICAQLTSTAFYQGDYAKALEYANRCHELSGKFEEPCLFIRALYLESAVHRALAGKSADESAQQASYSLAVKIAEKAADFYDHQAVNDPNLKGKIYFNLGAAHADNPRGDLSKASICYSLALDCYKSANAVDDLVRTKIRLGKVYLLQKNYAAVEAMIREVRSQVSNDRITMQADYLEAQLKIAIGDIESAIQIARTGIQRAEKLGAKEDQRRFALLLQEACPSRP